MTDDGGIRASDADREHVVEILREAYSAGRLTLEEFDERTTAAFAARTWGALRELTSDLPHQPRLAAAPSAPAPVPPRPGQHDPVRNAPPRRLSPMLPVMVLWLGIVATVKDPFAFVPVFVFLMVLLQLTGRPPRRGPGPPRD